MAERSTSQQGRRGQAGFRMTPQRAAILEAVQAADGHLTAAEIFERVHARYPSIAYGTVYRTLHLFAEHGLILEFPFGDEASRFDRRTDRHDHVRCTECGALVDVEVPTVLFARQVAAEQTGWQVTGHQTVFTGMCPACQEARRSALRSRREGRDFRNRLVD